MNIFFGYIAFVAAFMAVGCIVLYAVEKLIFFLYKQFKEFFFPTPQIPEDVYEQICKEASDLAKLRNASINLGKSFIDCGSTATITTGSE